MTITSSTDQLNLTIFGSTQLQGYGLTPLIDSQGIKQTMLLLQHLRLNDLIGKMLAIGYSWYQTYCGVSYQTLQHPAPVIPHSPLGWFQHLCSFLSYSDISVELLATLLHLPQLLCRGDMNLVEAFLTLGWKKPKIKLLNNCRLFLQFKTLAKLCDADGSHLLPAAWNGTTLSSTSTLLWRPGPTSLLGSLFLLDTTSTYCQVATLRLCSRMGRWSSLQSMTCIPNRYPSVYQIPRGYLGYEVTPQGCHLTRIFNGTPVGRNFATHNLDGAVPADPGPI